MKHLYPNPESATVSFSSTTLSCFCYGLLLLLASFLISERNAAAKQKSQSNMRVVRSYSGTVIRTGIYRMQKMIPIGKSRNKDFYKYSIPGNKLEEWLCHRQPLRGSAQI